MEGEAEKQGRYTKIAESAKWDLSTTFSKVWYCHTNPYSTNPLPLSHIGNPMYTYDRNTKSQVRVLGMSMVG
jgi:hypothetical protein